MSELLEQCFKGDRKAWDDFVQRYTPYIYAAVKRIVASHISDPSPQLIDDIVQDVFIRLLKNDMKYLRTHDPSRCKLSTWVTIVARSTAIDALRRRKPPSEPLENQLIFQAAPGESPEEAAIEDAISLPEGVLSERQELVLHLLFDRGLETAEAARVLGVDPQSIRSTKYKAIKKLREYAERKELP